MCERNDFFRVQNYYKIFAPWSIPAVFVPLTDDDVAHLEAGDMANCGVKGVIPRIKGALHNIPGKHFVSVDYCAPTDCPRYLSSKRGAVVSAESAWNSLAASQKVASDAAAGRVSMICLRAFRVFDIPREFRLFIKDGELVAMSQRFLIRHFRRLQCRREKYWAIANCFYRQVRDLIPVKDLTIDIYITSKRKVIVIDVNPWGNPTDPLMLNTWDRDFARPLGCLIVPPPQMISGNVNVSF